MLDNLTRKQRGISTIVGGFMVQFVLGILYLWGNINVYVRSYFCYEGDYGLTGDFCEGCTLTTSTVNIVFPFILTALIVAMPFGSKVADKFGARNYSLFAAFICGGSVFLSSYFKSFWGFSFLYGIVFGLFGGICYLIPFYLAHKFFPLNKGLCSGIVSSGFGMGSFIFSLIQYQMVNPDNEHFESGCTTKDIANNLPASLRWSGIIYFVLFFLGGLLLFTPNERDLKESHELIQKFEEEQKVKRAQNKKDAQDKGLKHKEHVDLGECRDMKSVLKQPILWIGILHVICLSGSGIIYSSNYKPYGSTYFDDSFLTWVGNAGNIVNSLSRFFWGYMMDKLSYKLVLIIMPCIQILVSALITTTTSSQGGYFIMLLLSYFAYGGFYSIFPTVFSHVYGKKFSTIASGIVFLGFALASWIQFFIVRNVVDGDTTDQTNSQYEDVFHLYIISPCLAIILTILIKYEINWNKVYHVVNKVSDSEEQVGIEAKQLQKQQSELPEKQQKQQPDEFGAKAPTESPKESMLS